MCSKTGLDGVEPQPKPERRPGVHLGLGLELRACRGRRTDALRALDVGADAAAAREHLSHGDGAVQVELVVVGQRRGQRRGQIQLVLLDAAEAQAVAAVPQAVRLLQVEGHVVVRAGRTERLRAGQLSHRRRGREQSRPVGGGCRGDRRSQDVVVGVNGRQTRRHGEIRLLLLRLGLLLLTAIILKHNKNKQIQYTPSFKSGSEGVDSFPKTAALALYIPQSEVNPKVSVIFRTEEFMLKFFSFFLFNVNRSTALGFEMKVSCESGVFHEHVTTLPATIRGIGIFYPSACLPSQTSTENPGAVLRRRFTQTAGLAFNPKKASQLPWTCN